MKKITSFILSLALVCTLQFPARGADEKLDSWKAFVQNLEARIVTGSLGEDFRISFQNRPYQKYIVEELMIYTVSADGQVVIQMGNQVREFKILPADLYGLCKFLLEHNLEGLVSDTKQTKGSASFSLILSNRDSRKSLYLYRSRNDLDREIIWQYMFRFGQILYEKAGLRDKNEPILPVCKGITNVLEIDSDNDGLIDWYRIIVGFYNFRAGDFSVDFFGSNQDLFLAEGNSSKEFLLNGYLLQSGNEDLKSLFKLGINAKEGNWLGPYIMDMGLGSWRDTKKNLRKLPDFVLQGAAAQRFKVNLNQTVVLGIKKVQSPDDEALDWFCLSGILPDGSVKLISRDSPEFVLGQEDLPLIFLGCISSYLRLCKINGASAIFEVGWRVPDNESLVRRISHYREIIASHNYRGAVETIMSSLEIEEKCMKDLESQQDLEIDINFCSPPAQKADSEE